jgi:hypothetical protein
MITSSFSPLLLLLILLAIACGLCGFDDPPPAQWLIGPSSVFSILLHLWRLDCPVRCGRENGHMKCIIIKVTH